MSEPLQKGEIDLKSLENALGDGEAASDLPAETLQKNSDTLAQPAADARASTTPSATTPNAHKASSPATLSPSSPRAMSPVQAPARNTSADMPPAVAELKAMFPDLDTDTIAAVLSSRGGDQEAAVNALLQMSDPSFKPSTTDTRTDSDALLAQTIAMEEEQRHHELLARQQQQRISQTAGRGGGGAGSFFGGLLGSDSREASAPSTPSYDPNALTYQPRVRRAAAPAPARTAYAPPNHPPASSPSYADGESVIPGMPGAKEAKQWQEEINRMAETGLARAASTFSSLREKASAAFNNPQDGSAQGSQAGAAPGGSGSTGAGFAQAFQNFRAGAGRGGGGASQENATSTTAAPARAGFTSPRSPHASEYDQDPSPVSDNELAKIISRGGGAGAAGGASDKSAAGKARALAERYGLGIKGAGRGGASTTQAAGTGASSSEAEFAGWDQAGRTPISIKDNTANATSAEPKSKDSVALMDSAQGRGLTTPRPADASVPAAATGAAVGAVAATAAGATSVGSAHTHHDHDDANDSDDLEYVSNPFEDED